MIKLRNMINYPAKGAGKPYLKAKIYTNNWKYFTKRCTKKGLVAWECHLHGLMICTSTLHVIRYLASIWV